ncbi:MAG: nucleotide-binding protein [Burkholderiaceae bacterium]|nr:nucleotide-binding protein [Burkholderiaceae bacterium]
MKYLPKPLTIAGMLVIASITSSVWAASVTGVILEVRDVDSYTYVRVKTKEGETWAAVGKAPLKKGATVVIEDAMVMKNFESKALRRTFPTIIFGTLAGSAKNTSDPHAGVAKVLDSAPILVAKATGANARTVAEVATKGAELKDQQVQVRGKVVKFSPQIMGKNWIHLRDGTGSASDNSNDVLVTSSSKAQVGDVVTVTGVVRVDKDFGAGYVYKVLIEEATLQP